MNNLNCIKRIARKTFDKKLVSKHINYYLAEHFRWWVLGKFSITAKLKLLKTITEKI